MATAPIPAGSHIVLSCGSYSDYSIRVLGRVLKDITAEVWAAMRVASQHTRPAAHGYLSYTHHNSDAAQAWLIKQGYIEEIDYDEMRIDAVWEWA